MTLISGSAAISLKRSGSALALVPGRVHRRGGRTRLMSTSTGLIPVSSAK